MVSPQTLGLSSLSTLFLNKLLKDEVKLIYINNMSRHFNDFKEISEKK